MKYTLWINKDSDFLFYTTVEVTPRKRADSPWTQETDCVVTTDTNSGRHKQNRNLLRECQPVHWIPRKIGNQAWRAGRIGTQNYSQNVRRQNKPSNAGHAWSPTAVTMGLLLCRDSSRFQVQDGGGGAHLSLGNSPRVSPGSWVRALGVGIRGAKVAVPPTKTKWGASWP